MDLHQNVHRFGLENPPNDIGRNIRLIKGSYSYYHYMCDQFDDRGWGCGYRTLQELQYCPLIKWSLMTEQVDIV